MISLYTFLKENDFRIGIPKIRCIASVPGLTWDEPMTYEHTVKNEDRCLMNPNQ